MHLLLTDRLACPRCGPGFGLVLLADRVEDRRVLEGRLGCPNCRDRFVVAGGFADLRAPPRALLPDEPPPGEPEPEAALRLAALLGVAEGPAHVALVGAAAAHATLLAGMIPELEVVAVSPAARGAPETPGVSRIASAPGLAFRDATLQGVALAGDTGARAVEEAARVVVPGGRVVLQEGPGGTGGLAEAAGLRVVLEEAGVVVALRGGPRTPGGGVRLPVV